ncbi:hypothetical protein Nham_3089 [Nitrobacter hamburgensis X14]|uniref:Uncharacterized protein n=1 Tax=Nitrobacter hamburgensis (strain DSM 10229 / NCIMB 13809 / X14) TaxID=323097 RepID=Q1QIX1_NITHX|nr:hypothetical protein Nham_3089 [Nitrobacter hamburgensis X14]
MSSNLVSTQIRKVLEFVKPPAATVNEYDTTEAALERIRGVITMTAREFSRVRDAGLPVSELKTQARTHVASLASRGRARGV